MLFILNSIIYCILITYIIHLFGITLRSFLILILIKLSLLLFYNSTVGQQLHDPKYGYQLMSDTYIVNDIKAEIAGR